MVTDVRIVVISGYRLVGVLDIAWKGIQDLFGAVRNVLYLDLGRGFLSVSNM